MSIATKNYNKGMSEEVNFFHECFHEWYAGREILCSDFSNTEDVTARELSLAKSIGYCILPRGIDLVELRQFHTQIEECYATDPILPEIYGKDDILDGITVRFSSFPAFLNAGSLDTLHTLIERGAQVKKGRFWVSINSYISRFFPTGFRKGTLLGRRGE